MLAVIATYNMIASIYINKSMAAADPPPVPTEMPALIVTDIVTSEIPTLSTDQTS